MILQVQQLLADLREAGYVADRSIATPVHLALQLERPLLVEGAAGVGKTEIARALSVWLDAPLIRLQCYEGLDVHTALYEWNYARQLLRLRITDEAADPATVERSIFTEEFLLERPLLRAIRSPDRVVLLIDEIDRADEEFEAFLLEILSEFQVSIPELGTVSAASRPVTVLTSNGTRELSDALRRRCLYLWIDYPSLDKELEILRLRVPELSEPIRLDIARFTQALRERPLSKVPGLSEAIDFANAVRALGTTRFGVDPARDALGALLKDRHDLHALDEDELDRLIEASRRAEAG